MQYVKNVTSVYNVGHLDAGIRLTLGILLLLPVLLQDNIILHLSDLSALLSIYPIVTALIKCDPIYELLGISTYSHSGEKQKHVKHFMETSRSYLSSLGGTRKVNHSNPAKNDGGDDKLKTA